MTKILIVAGEASGDLHGANLARTLLELDSAIQLVGVGGAAMKSAGVQLVEGFGHLDVMGIVGFSALSAIIRRFAAMRRLLDLNGGMSSSLSTTPDSICDMPGLPSRPGCG